MRIFRDQKGVTLLELVIGLVLFGIIALGFTQALMPSLRLMVERSDVPEDWLHNARSCAESIIAQRQVEEDQCSSLCGNAANCDSLQIQCVSDVDTREVDDVEHEYCRINISAPDNDELDDIILGLRIM